MAMPTDKRTFEIVLYYITHGKDATCKQYGVNAETITRYERQVKKQFGDGFDFGRLKNAASILGAYTDTELDAISKGRTLTVSTGIPEMKIDTKTGEWVTIGAMTDTHIGSKSCMETAIKDAIDEINETCDIFCHSGDVSEGMSHRPGHIYELTDLGFDAQKQKCIDIFSKVKKPAYIIDGNHDRWYIKSNGALIVKDICDAINGANGNTNFNFLGHDVGEFKLNGVRVMLWHGEDSSSYALSYRIQKIIESFSGGTKPQILFAGHVHKAGYFFIRNIHAFSAGCMEVQTPWMRGKRIEAHTGWWKIRLLINKNSIVRCAQEFIPFYV